MGFKSSFFLVLVLIGCVNKSKDQKSANNFQDASLKNKDAAVNARDTTKAINKMDESTSDSTSFKEYDLYQFENDTLIQSAYIHYLTARKIRFLVRTKNKTSLNVCEHSDTATMAGGEGTGQGSDELKEDELYGVYEYFTNKTPFFTIDVEFKRGKRLTIFTKADMTLCKADCPLSSKGTLRRKKLSQEKQNNPTW